MKHTDLDKSIDRLLRRGLRRESIEAQPGAQCVDPETLAAWMDGSLSGHSLARAEQHASDCARCQAMLASMARTAPVTDPRPWWRTLAARWLVPVAAAATAFAIWVAVDRERSVPPAPVAPSQAERMEAPDPGGAALTRDSGDAGAAAMPTAGAGRLAHPSEPLPKRSGLPQRTAPAEAARGSARRAEKRETAVPDVQVLAGTAASRDRTAFMATPAPAASASTRGGLGPSTTPVAPMSAPPPPAAAPSAARPPAAESPAPKALAETVAVSSEVARDAPQGIAGGRVASGVVDIVSPEPAFRWRLVSPAAIQRSTDGGATWTSQSNRAPGLSFLGGTQNAVTPARLNAGSAPARDICWIVGSEGIVLLSTDGVSWQRRPFPEPVNLTAVRAVDAKVTVVTSEDGRQFSTADGGATWSKIP